MTKTLIILNPHAAGGRAGKIWHQYEPMLWDKLGELVIAITQRPEEVAAHLDKARAVGITRVISIGGDGTNHVLVNALIELNRQHPTEPRMEYGCLPVGTGRDWARTLGIPLDLENAVQWITKASAKPVDIGLMTFDGKSEYFLNIASAGISGEVDRHVNNVKNRRPWTFYKATVLSLLTYKPQPLQIKLDDKDWYEGRVFAVIVANGTTFGHGMKIAPNAKVDDGMFDVILIEDMFRLRAIAALQQVYDGSHLQHPKVRAAQAQQVKIQSASGAISLDLDGETATGQNLSFEIKPGLLPLPVTVLTAGRQIRAGSKLVDQQIATAANFVHIERRQAFEEFHKTVWLN